VASDTDKTGQRPNTDVFVVPLGGGPARNVTAENPAGDGSPRYSPDGTFLAWTANRIPGAPDRERVMVLDRKAEGAAPSDLSAAWDRSAAELRWAPDSQSLLVVAEDRPTRRLFRIPVAGGAPRALTEAGDFAGVAAAGQSLVALRSSFSQPPTLMRLDPAGSGRPRQISRFNDALLSGVRLGNVESVTYKGARGADIQMWIVRPPDFSASRRWPLMLLLHGGPHVGVTDQWAWRWNAQVFAGWGYVTAWHNFHGSSGFGDAFTDAINPDWLSLPYEDTIKAADWFRAQRWIDPSRMVAAGGSYGGYLAATLLGRAHPFKALVAHAPVYNMYTQVGADYGAVRSRHYEFWENPAAFEAKSPHMAAGEFRTPTLVIHGQQDLRVPMTHAVEMFHALQLRGVPSRLITYPNENHWILRPRNSIHWYGEVRTWVERYAPPGGR
jgi:dipeptidyl aminopeptidase/acylaminoacyl peptidase